MYLVELLVASAVVPLTFASLAVITLPFTLPIILNLQAAATAAVAEGERTAAAWQDASILDQDQAARSSLIDLGASAADLSGMTALRRSQQLVRPVRWQLAVPFVGLVAVRRLLETARSAAMTAMPQR